MGRSDDALETLGLGIDNPLAGISSAIFEWPELETILRRSLSIFSQINLLDCQLMLNWANCSRE